jgi:PilZ domain
MNHKWTFLDLLIGTMERLFLAQACDISRGGLKLLLAHKFERGTTLRITTVNDGPEKLGLVMAEVRYAVPTCQGKWMMGCAFLKELSEKEMQALGKG